jgi:hypothetical protein
MGDMTFNLDLTIHARTKDELLHLLSKSLIRIAQGCYCCSEHPDSYMPYLWWDLSGHKNGEKIDLLIWENK